MTGTSFFLPNITAILIIIGLFTSSYRSLDYNCQDVRVISTLSVLTVFEGLFEIFSHLVNGVSALVWLNCLFNSLMFIINAFAGFSWVLYVKIKLDKSDGISVLKKHYLLAIPALVVTVMAIVNFFFPVFYRITADSIYERTSLYILPIIVAGAYVILGAIDFQLRTGRNRKYKFYPVYSFLFPVAFFAALQQLNQELNLTSLGLAIGIALLYLNFKNEQACIDSLTGLFNRQYFDRHLLHNIKKHHSDNRYLVGIMLDIDRFKSINDTYGHLTGNDAIREAARILLQVERHSKSNMFCFRYGGDEFVVLQFAENEGAVHDIVNRIKDYTADFNTTNDKPYTIEFSIGYAIFDPSSDTAETFTLHMDDAMYRDKNAKKLSQKHN